MKLNVDLGKDSYPIYIDRGALSHISDYVKETYTGKKIMLVSDDHVFPHYGEKIMEQLRADYDCFHVVLPSGEATKSFETLPKLYSAFLEAGITRSDLIVALGGGVIGDLTGFAASSYLRGVKFAQIPTSILAQVDSSVGGKVAVDLPEGKNLVGAFYQPQFVVIDPDVLATLPERYINDGMGEVIKYGCILDKELFELLEERAGYEHLLDVMETIIYRCVDCKRMVVEEDPFDLGKRMLLNFGHTLAHTIEQYYHYERESHGEAVAIGMYQITQLAEDMKITDTQLAQRIKKVLHAYHLPCECGVGGAELLDAIYRDKKNLNGHLNVILLKDIGDSDIHETTVDFFEKNRIY